MSAHVPTPARADRLDPHALTHALRDFDRFPVSLLIRKASKRLYEECRQEQLHTREFTQRHLWPFVDAWDRQVGQDHRFVAWPAIEAGVGYGMLSTGIPQMFGGRGALAIAIHSEELAAADAGVALAHTEPGAGSDVEDAQDIRRARVRSTYRRVDGGYRLDARKVFISNGSIARYVVFTAYGDPKRPHETGRGFVVASDTPGFAVGRVERKLGQRLCPAAELIAEDVFVPDDDSAALDDTGRMIDTVLSMTRGPVGAMSTGIARGALERSLRYLAQKRAGDHWLFEEQWVRLALADMLGTIQACRGLYVDAALALEHWGFGKVMRLASLRLPAVVRRSRLLEVVLTSLRVARQTRESYAREVSHDELERCVAIASTAKFMCSDAAVRVCMKAMEILGEDASDPQWGVEKCLRDAKLGQIFEGTNQINRLHVTRGLLRWE